MIRRATLADLPVLLRHGRAFVAALPYAEQIDLDEASFARSMQRAMADELVLIAEGGAGSAAMAFYPAFHNDRCLIGQELFWWVEPGRRDGTGLALLEALEAAAEARGAVLIRMACVTGLRDAALGRLYRRRGYVESDRGFMRRLAA